MTAAEQRAAEAWAKVVRKRSIFDHFSGSEPMPPLVAVDFVQDEVGERTEAVRLLLTEAAQRMREKIPPAEYHPHSSLGFMSNLATSLCDSLCEGSVDWRPAVGMRRIVSEHIAPGADLWALEDWRQWTLEAERVLQLCEQIKEGLPSEQAEA